MCDYAGNFIFDIIDEDYREGRHDSVHTRFPPEPNGYLHIGSAKAIYINYITAKKYGGLFNLRYDDTNPVREEDEYVDAILEDLKWLGTEPTGGVFYGSDYFQNCYDYAVKLIKDGKAYVDELTPDEIREYRGSLTEPGRSSPYRDRPISENLDLFERMKNGEFEDETYTLRAKIDMESPNMNMRDPIIYRILHAEHHRQGDEWCIYPLYDFAHPIQDAIEGITHSLCSIEFENHRPLYDWVVDNIGIPEREKPHQYEFARLNMTYTVMSKRYLRTLVETGVVDGWDDPRMPTLHALRRRGYTPSSIFKFIETAGISKAYSIVDIELLEHCIRDELNQTAERRMAVLDPVKVILTNYPEDKTEVMRPQNNPSDENAGRREVPFSKEIYIEKEDFSVSPPPKYFRLAPGREVRLMGSYVIKCDDFKLNDEGEVEEIYCSVDFDTLGKNPSDGRKIKGTIQWVSCENNYPCEVRMYGRLFSLENVLDMPEGKTYGDYLCPDSLTVYPNAKLEITLKDATIDERFQFVRIGYFIRDSRDGNVFNSIVGLKDSWAKISKSKR
ncbi:MAG: glutamine--tRNA ligase/YqeY domain fusion protein [Ruminococcaceae bacterium]|nr:glutamine--tRNA ligase/YqeY domain fusion protein [Oscillospiraceae bacterium]